MSVWYCHQHAQGVSDLKNKTSWLISQIVSEPCPSPTWDCAELTQGGISFGSFRGNLVWPSGLWHYSSNIPSSSMGLLYQWATETLLCTQRLFITFIVHRDAMVYSAQQATSIFRVVIKCNILLVLWKFHAMYLIPSVTYLIILFVCSQTKLLPLSLSFCSFSIVLLHIYMYINI